MSKMRDLNELEQLFDKAASEWENRIVMRGANRMGTGARDECKKLTQTRTGSMKKSWFFRIDHKKGEIVIWLSNPMEYAPYVNNGHRIVRAKNASPKSTTEAQEAVSSALPKVTSSSLILPISSWIP